MCARVCLDNVCVDTQHAIDHRDSFVASQLVPLFFVSIFKVYSGRRNDLKL